MQKRHCASLGGARENDPANQRIGGGGAFIPPRKSVSTAKQILFSHFSCRIWGQADIADRVFVLVQDGQFDFTSFFYGVSIPQNTALLIFDMCNWKPNLQEALKKFLQRFDGSNQVHVMAAGGVCVDVALVVNQCLEKHSPSNLVSAAFLSPSNSNSNSHIRALDAFTNFPVLLQGSNNYAVFDRMFAKAQVSRNFHDWFKALFVEHEVVPLTQYSPDSSTQQHVETPTALALVCEIYNVHFNRPTVRCFRFDLQQYISLNQCQVQPGDVIRVESTSNAFISLLKKDDPMAMDFVQLVNQQSKIMPLIKPPSSQVVKLAHLIENTVQAEGRSDFPHILVVSVRNLELIVTDDSLPAGVFASIRLLHATGLHKPSDFYAGLHVQLLGVKIEWKQDRFNAVLDNQSGVVVLPQCALHTSKLNVHFVQLEALVDRSILRAGEYRVRATVKDVFLAEGVSWASTLSKQTNLFAFAPHLQAAFQQHSEVVVLLSDISDQVFVRCNAVNEILPFVDKAKVTSGNVQDLFESLVLVKQVLDALVFADNADFDFTLQVVNDEAIIHMVRLDI